MFVGTINEDLRSLVAEITRGWDVEDIYIGCSGNFTIERTLKDRGFRLHGNDVSLYTCAIGEHLAGRDLPVTIAQPDYEWMEPYMAPGIPKLATLILCTSMLDGYGRSEPYFVRRRNAYQAQWEKLHAKTCENVARALDGVKIEEFWPGDVVEWAQSSPADAGFISFPPTYKGGYERIYKAFGHVFDWETPPYEMFDDDRLQEMVDSVKAKKAWILARDVVIPGLEEYEVARVRTSLHSHPFIVYANGGHSRITMPHQKLEPIHMERLVPNDEITADSKFGVVKITQGQMNTLRSQYLNPGIAPAGAMLNLGVMVDGKLIGAIGLSKSRFGEGAYLMSDFTIRPTQYKRLSKLVLAAVLSVEVRLLFEQVINAKVDVIQTTAFTSKPVSMKYRGMFEITSRKKDPPRINYEAAAGKWTLREGMKWWIQGHAKT